MAVLPKPADDIEEKFRKDNLWHSFLGAMYGAIGGASFFGVLNNLVGMAIQGGGGFAKMGEPTTMLLVGGLSAVGIAATYLAQREFTYLKVISDDHLAHRNAICMAEGRSHEVAQQVSAEKAHEHHEHPQNQRGDGKQWRQVVQPHAETARTL